MGPLSKQKLANASSKVYYRITKSNYGNEKMSAPTTTPLFYPGTTYNSSGKNSKVCTVINVLTTHNLAGDLVAIRYVTTHDFMGQKIISNSVLQTTIAMRLIKAVSKEDFLNK